MRAVILTVVAMVVIGLGGALDYSLAAKAAGTGYGFGAHLTARMNLVKGLLPASDLARAMPAAPPGWTGRAGTDEDSFLARGLPVDPVELAQSQAVDAAMAGSIRGVQVARRTYQSGAQTIYLDITFVPANARATRGARMMDALFQAMAAHAGASLTQGDLSVYRLSEPDFGAAALYFGQMGPGAVYVSALSSADEGVTLDLLHGLDLTALAQAVAKDPTIGKAPVTEDPAPVAAKAEKLSPCTTRGAAKFCGAGG